MYYCQPLTASLTSPGAFRGTLEAQESGALKSAGSVLVASNSLPHSGPAPPPEAGEVEEARRSAAEREFEQFLFPFIFRVCRDRTLRAEEDARFAEQCRRFGHATQEHFCIRSELHVMCFRALVVYVLGLLA
jgi:hypothetical protein